VNLRFPILSYWHSPLSPPLLPTLPVCQYKFVSSGHCVPFRQPIISESLRWCSLQAFGLEAPGTRCGCSSPLWQESVASRATIHRGGKSDSIIPSSCGLLVSICMWYSFLCSVCVSSTLYTLLVGCLHYVHLVVVALHAPPLTL
jgi:hypothetical protein